MPANPWTDLTTWMKTDLEPWLEANDVLLGWLGFASAVIAVGTLLAMPWVVSRIPTRYFATKELPPLRERSDHPVVRWLLRFGKNTLGLFLVLFGLIASIPLVPGQGMMMALAGLLLLEFPGKRRMEMWLIRRPGLLRGINWLRSYRGRPPLVVWSPEDDEPAEEPRRPAGPPAAAPVASGEPRRTR